MAETGLMLKRDKNNSLIMFRCLDVMFFFCLSLFYFYVTIDAIKNQTKTEQHSIDSDFKFYCTNIPQ